MKLKDLLNIVSDSHMKIKYKGEFIYEGLVNEGELEYDINESFLDMKVDCLWFSRMYYACMIEISEF